MNLQEYLRSQGFEEEKIQELLPKIKVDFDEFIDIVDFYKLQLDLPEKDVLETIKRFPYLVNDDVFGESKNSIKNKLVAYKHNFYMNSTELASAFVKEPYFLEYDIESSIETAYLYRQILKISVNDFKKMFIKKPCILDVDIFSHQPGSVKWRIKFFQENFALTRDDVLKLLKWNPNLLVNDILSDKPTSIQFKIEFYNQRFHFSRADWGRILRCNPFVFNYDVVSNLPNSVESKFKFYKETFEVDDAQLGRMIVFTPLLINYDVESTKSSGVKSKIEYLLQLTDKKSIVKNPDLLTIPALKIKTRYLLLSQGLLKQEILSYRYLMLSEKKVYARAEFVKEKNLYFRRVVSGEKHFKRMHDVSSEHLQEKYPLTEDVIDELEIKHYQKRGEKIKISKEERDAIFGRSDSSADESELQ